jgi:hypothetical protein
MVSKSYSKGISWIDDCRIPFVDEVGIKISGDKKHLQKWKEKDGREKRNIDEIQNTPYINTQGRFPANLLVSDDMLNDGSVSSIKQNKDYIPPNEANSIHNYSRGKYSGIQDKGTNSRYYDIDRWFNNLIDV